MTFSDEEKQQDSLITQNFFSEAVLLQAIKKLQREIKINEETITDIILKEGDQIAENSWLKFIRKEYIGKRRDDSPTTYLKTVVKVLEERYPLNENDFLFNLVKKLERLYQLLCRPFLSELLDREKERKEKEERRELALEEERKELRRGLALGFYAGVSIQRLKELYPDKDPVELRTMFGRIADIFDASDTTMSKHVIEETNKAHEFLRRYSL